MGARDDSERELDPDEARTERVIAEMEEGRRRAAGAVADLARELTKEQTRAVARAKRAEAALLDRRLRESEREAAVRADRPLTMEIASEEEIVRAMVRSESMDKEAGTRWRRLIDERFDDGRRTTRPLAALPDPAFLSVLDDEFPLFGEVTRSVTEQAGLSWRLREADEVEQPAHFRPILIEGRPGYGKTTYVRRLAELLGTPFREIQMGSMTAGFVLAGGDPSWSSSKAGLVFDEVTGGRANPILLLDEIDKMSGDGRYRPDGALYALLERDGAARFVDEFAGFPIDASAVSWVATANDLGRVPDALISRFEVFSIPEPTAEHARATLIQVYRGILRENAWGRLFDDAPDEGLIEALIGVSPREAKRRLLRAFGVCSAGSRRPREGDLPEEGTVRSGMGFVR